MKSIIIKNKQRITLLFNKIGLLYIKYPMFIEGLIAIVVGIVTRFMMKIGW